MKTGILKKSENWIKDKIDDFHETKFGHNLKKFFDKGNRRFVLFLYIIAFLVFAATLFTKGNNFTIPINGDFKLQFIPFLYNEYDDLWTMLTTGSFPLWDDSAFLGVNNLGANTFYYLYNIFSYPILLFPRSIAPQIQSLIIMTKFVLAGYFMKLLLNYMNVSESSSKVVATAYGFCGWSFFYLWFYQFGEIAVLIPIVLLGIEKVLREKKIFALTVSLFLTAMTNYYFFIMFCFCGVIYAIFRYFQLWNTYSNKDRWQVILLGFLCFLIALIMAMIVILPAFSVALENPRTEASAGGFTDQLISNLRLCKQALVQGDIGLALSYFNKSLEVSLKFGTIQGANFEKDYYYPVVSFFYPPVTCYNSILFNNSYYDNTNCSLYVYVPLILMLIPSILTSIREKRISHIIGVIGILILLFTPFAYYCFSGFTSVCYGRWEIFVVACTCIYIGINLDKIKQMKPWYFDISVCFCLAMQIYMLIVGLNYQGTGSTNKLDGRETICIVELIYLFIAFIIMRFSLKRPHFNFKLRYLIAIEAIIIGNVVIEGQGTSNYSKLYGGIYNVEAETSLVNTVKKKDNSYYRIYNSSANRDSINIAMNENYRGSNTFHSIYNFELQNFIDWSQASYSYHGWTLGVMEKRCDLDTFLNMKYYLVNKEDTNIPFRGVGYTLVTDDNNVPLCENGKVIYENNNYIPLGFSFDNLIDSNNMLYTFNGGNYQDGAVEKNESLYVRGAILSFDDIKTINENYNFTNTKINDEYYSKYLKVYAPKKSDIIIYKAVWDKEKKGVMDGYARKSDKDGGILLKKDLIKDPTDNFLIPKNDLNIEDYEDSQFTYTEKDATHLLYSSYVEIDTSSYDFTKEATSENPAFVTVKARMGENLIITLYDENNEVIVQDRHMKHNYSKTGNVKYERGFYVDRPVYKIRIRVADTFGANAVLIQPKLTCQYYSEYKKNIDQLKENQLSNVVIGINDYSFDTNYDENRFVVLTIPYDKGWSYKAIDESGNVIKNTHIYKAQGGFIGFISEEGATHYVFTYRTPKLSEGIVLFGIGSTMFGILYIVVEINKKNKEIINDQLGI